MTFEENKVHNALQALDSNLFLDKRWSAFSGVYYVAASRLPDGSVLDAVDWRDGARAKPLSLDLVDRVRGQEGSLSEAVAQATANNAARKELLRQERLAAQDEAIEDWQKSKPGKLGVVISKALPQSPDR